MSDGRSDDVLADVLEQLQLNEDALDSRVVVVALDAVEVVGPSSNWTSSQSMLASSAALSFMRT